MTYFPSLTSQKPMTLVIGGVAVVSMAALVYTLTRPTKEKKTKSAKRTGPKFAKFSKRFTKKPIDVTLVMFNDEGFHAHVATGVKNLDMGLKYGARLISIQGRRVEDLPYEEIFDLLIKAKVPLTLKFREFPDLEKQWTRAEQLKDEANKLYKKGDIEAGIECVTNAIGLHNTNKTYYSNRVLMLLKLKKYDDALRDCHKIRQLDPKSVYIKGHYLRGLVLFNLEKYKNAASAFQTVVKLNPTFKQAKDRLGECMTHLETENIVHQRKRSSQHEQLKKALLERDDVDVDEDDAAVVQDNNNNNNNSNSNSNNNSNNNNNEPTSEQVAAVVNVELEQSQEANANAAVVEEEQEVEVEVQVAEVVAQVEVEPEPEPEPVKSVFEVEASNDDNDIEIEPEVEVEAVVEVADAVVAQVEESKENMNMNNNSKSEEEDTSSNSVVIVDAVQDNNNDNDSNNNNNNNSNSNTYDNDTTEVEVEVEVEVEPVLSTEETTDVTTTEATTTEETIEENQNETQEEQVEDTASGDN